MSDVRMRNFTFIVYPDSVNLPKDWKSQVEDWAIPTLISPLHDKDIDPGTGELKKAHYHVVISFSGKKSIQQVLDLVQPLGVKFVDVVHDLHGIARYLCHLDFFDRPDKRLYDPADVLAFNGADFQDLAVAPSDRNQAIAEMTQFIFETNTTNFYWFFGYCFKNHRSDWFPVLRDSDAKLFNYLLRSKSDYFKEKDSKDHG